MTKKERSAQRPPRQRGGRRAPDVRIEFPPPSRSDGGGGPPLAAVEGAISATKRVHAEAWTGVGSFSAASPAVNKVLCSHHRPWIAGKGGILVMRNRFLLAALIASAAPARADVVISTDPTA